LPDLLNPRSNFAAISLDNYIYAFGGVSGNQNDFHSRLPEFSCERLNYASPTNWEQIEIERSPSIFAFGWTKFTDEGKIVVYGGSDGQL
jgi:N-acetylneuraminic acid mutarotase